MTPTTVHRSSLTRSAVMTAALALAVHTGCDANPTRATTTTTATAATTETKAKSPPTPEWKRLVETWEYPAPIPNFELTNQDGKRFHLAEFSKSYVLVGLIFTRCSVPKACPLTTTKMRDVQKLWAKRQAAGTTRGRELQLLTLTFDPGTDTPPVLKKYGEKYGADFSNWTFATGPDGLMSTGLPSLLGLLAMPEGGGSYAHSVKAALLAPGLSDYKEWNDNAFIPQEVVDLVLKGAPSKNP